MTEENGHDHHKPCGVVNFYCGDKDPPHPPHKHDCCDSCDAALEGHTFAGYTDVGYITPVATELANELLVNPVGSGKLLYVRRRAMTAVGSDDENIIFRFYFDPQLVAQGGVGTITCLNQSPATQPSVAQLWTSPTVAAFGMPIDIANVSAPGAESDELIVLGEGHSLLVTVRANAENSRAAAVIYWTECRVHHRPMPTP